MANKSVAQEKADRREAMNRDLATRKQQAENAIKSTSGLVSGALSKLQEAQRKRKAMLDNL